MGALIALPVLACLAALWGFLKFPPSTGTPRQIMRFNILILAIGAMMLFVWYMNSTVYLKEQGLPKYIPLFGIGGGAAAGFVYLLVFFLIRNFFVFRGRTYGPDRF